MATDLGASAGVMNMSFCPLGGVPRSHGLGGPAGKQTLRTPRRVPAGGLRRRLARLVACATRAARG
jgi:hypothetical protein